LSDKLPEHYFCPKCHTEATEDFILALKKDLPAFQVVNMALHILVDARCRIEFLTPIAKWAIKYNSPETSNLDPEEQDKMALIKWKEWAIK